MRRLLLSATTLAAPAMAQQHDAQGWLQVNTVVPVAPRLRITLEQIARTSDRQGGLYQTEFGGILGYKAASGVELGIGYRAVGFHNRNPAANEHRLRQHVVLTADRVTARFRVDERFSRAGGGVGFRLRPLLRYNLPVGDGVALFASHESFFLPNTTRWGQRRGYERMRNAVGATVPVTGAVSADIGYLNQYRFARGDTRAQMDHAVSLQVTVNLAKDAGAHADD